MFSWNANLGESLQILYKRTDYAVSLFCDTGFKHLNSVFYLLKNFVENYDFIFKFFLIFIKFY